MRQQAKNESRGNQSAAQRNGSDRTGQHICRAGGGGCIESMKNVAGDRPAQQERWRGPTQQQNHHLLLLTGAKAALPESGLDPHSHHQPICWCFGPRVTPDLGQHPPSCA